ncbi:MAG TPA: phage holin family protein [Anaerolineales bacterium]|nr:phage holin family protein [Anaerolineales bacterium]
MRLLIRWLVTAIALGVAVAIVPGIHVEGDGPLYVAVTAIVLGLINAFVRPLLRLLSCPLVLLTLGLFLLVINAFTLWLSAQIAQSLFGIPFTIDGFLPALVGGVIVSVVSWGLNLLLPDEK